MQLHEAAKVIEVQGDEEANRLLAEGWKLLAVTSGIHVRDSGRSAVCYVLGKPAAKKDPLEGVNLGGMVSAVQMNVRD